MVGASHILEGVISSLNRMPTPKLTRDILEAAIDGFEVQKQRIESQIAELRQLLSGGPTVATEEPAAPRGRRTMSAAARKRIAEAQRKRWAEARGESAAAAPAAPKAKRRLSAAGRKAIIEATKRRWALVRAEKAETGGAAKKGNGKKKAAAE